MTLKDIAKEAGVSISTVSRVINQKNKKAASQETQDKIWEIIRKTGYIPNTAAQNLRRGDRNPEIESTHTIACIFARTEADIDNPFFSQLARCIEEYAYKHNYIVKYSFTAVDFEHLKSLKFITSIDVDGIVILGRCNRQILQFLKNNFHFVIYASLNPLPKDMKFDQIICDGLEVSKAAVNHLIELGHKNIAYIGETRNEIRYTGYRETLAAHRIPINNKNIVSVLLSSDGGYRGAKKLLSQTKDITAIFCPNDSTAVGTVHALHEAGISIPEDISIISVDDIEIAQYITPMLTTVHIPIKEMGEMSVKMLIDRIQNGHHIPLKIFLPYYITKRESCSKPK